jgi:hypothetical protein
MQSKEEINSFRANESMQFSIIVSSNVPPIAKACREVPYPWMQTSATYDAESYLNHCASGVC